MQKKNLSSRTKKAAAIVASALMAAAMAPSFAAPDTAFAADETRTYTWAHGTQQPDIPQTITGADGKEYRLVSQSAPVQSDGSQTITQYFAQTVNSQIWPDQLPNLGSITAASYFVNSDGFSGAIPRTGIDYAPVYRNEGGVVTGTKDAYGNTQEAARAALPATIDQGGRSLELKDVTFEPARNDSEGTTLWKATGHYEANVPRQVLDHYNVAAHYAGNLTKTTNSGDWSIQATYTNDDDTPVETGPDAEGENAEEEINELPAEFMDEFEEDSYSYDDGDSARNTSQVELAEIEDDDEGFIPVIPIAIAGGIAVAGIVVAGILIARRRKGASKGAAAAGAAGVAGAPALIEDAPAVVVIDDPECQLIQVTTIDAIDENGEPTVEIDQQTVAELEIIPSCAEDVPTVIYFPSLVDEDGERIEFHAAEDAQYWIAIDEDTVNQVPNKEIVIASDEDNEIFRGSLIDEDGDASSQMLLDAAYMESVMNVDEEAGLYNIADELAGYEAKTAGYMEQAEAAQNAEVAFEEVDVIDDGLFAFEDEDAGLFDMDLPDGEGIEFDDADDDGASYADIMFADDDASPETEETFDSAFEQEMDDYDPYDGIDEPDADDFDMDGLPIEDNADEVDEIDMLDDPAAADADVDGFDDELFVDADVIEIEDDDVEVIEDIDGIFADADEPAPSKPKRDIDPNNEYDRFQAMLDDID